MRELEAALRAYDGRSTSQLARIEAQFGGRAAYAPALVELSGDAADHVQSGATWLLRAHLAAGGCLSDVARAQLPGILARLHDWSAILHVLQSVRHLDLSGNQASRMADFAGGQTGHARPFIRAWALDALVGLAPYSADIYAQAKAALDRAQTDRAASVRARARNLTLPDRPCE